MNKENWLKPCNPGGWATNKKQGFLLLAGSMPVESAHDLHGLWVRHTLTKQANLYYEKREIVLNARRIFLKLFFLANFAFLKIIIVLDEIFYIFRTSEVVQTLFCIKHY